MPKKLLYVAAQFCLLTIAAISGAYLATIAPELPNALLRATGRNEQLIILPIDQPTGSQEWREPEPR